MMTRGARAREPADGTRSNVAAHPSAPRVLLVDDDVVIRTLMRVTLTVEGFDVVEATNGAEALTWLSRGGIDLVTLDEAMPDLSGWEVAARLRHRDPDGSVRVLLVTSGPPDTDRSPIIDACLAKPFDPRELIAIVRRLTT
jgi:DNA-binding response OmpR family regulator